MINLTDAAKEHLEDYLRQVRMFLQGGSVDKDEIEQNIREHIESELQEASEPVSYEALDAVLKKLGAPEQWISDEDIPGWRRCFMRLRRGPEDWRLAYITFGLFILWLLPVCFTQTRLLLAHLFWWPMTIMFGPGSGVLLVLSFIFARATLSLARDSKELEGKKVLIYPSLILFYIPVLLVMLFLPTVVSIGISVGISQSHNETIMQFRSSYEHLYWTFVVFVCAAVTFLWWLLLARIHKGRPGFLGTIFRPFIKTFKPKIANRIMGVMAGLTLVCAAALILIFAHEYWLEYM
ncbi:MAG: hypothetical protein JW936_10255 [Sedimentisphaerales bacterium]|nr:hypothetical protein [Sedimentisphaerales bacterium]